MTTFRDRLRRGTRLLRSGDRPWLTWLFWVAPWVTVAASVFAGYQLAGYLDDDLPPAAPPACLEALAAAEVLLALDDQMLTISGQMLYAGDLGDLDTLAELTAALEAMHPTIRSHAAAYWDASMDCRWPALSGEAAR